MLTYFLSFLGAGKSIFLSLHAHRSNIVNRFLKYLFHGLSTGSRSDWCVVGLYCPACRNQRAGDCVGDGMGQDGWVVVVFSLVLCHIKAEALTLFISF